MRNLTLVCTDAQSGGLVFYKALDGAVHAEHSFECSRSDGRGETASSDATLAQLVTAGAITGGERTTLLGLLAKVNNGLRTLAQLDPA